MILILTVVILYFGMPWWINRWSRREYIVEYTFPHTSHWRLAGSFCICNDWNVEKIFENMLPLSHFLSGRKPFILTICTIRIYFLSPGVHCGVPQHAISYAFLALLTWQNVYHIHHICGVCDVSRSLNIIWDYFIFAASLEISSSFRGTAQN